jgi:hypothetical protein
VSSDDRRIDKDVKTDSAAEEKSGSKASDSGADTPAVESKEEGPPSHSGLTRTFCRPVSDTKEDSLARRAEDIQSQYDQFQKVKKLAVSQVSGEFGDLLMGKPVPREEPAGKSTQEGLSGAADQDANKAVSESERPSGKEITDEQSEKKL